MNYWQDDKKLEESMLKSSLLFMRSNITDKRTILFQKYVFSLVLSGEVNTIKDIVDDFSKTHPNVYLDEAQVKSALDSLKKEKILDYNEDNISVYETKKEEASKYINEIQSDLDEVVSYILKIIKDDYKQNINNENQVISNIKSCFNYYFKIASLSYFDVDSQKEFLELSKLEVIASEGLNGQNELRDQIIYAVGKVINNPDEKQYCTLETMARIHVTAQIMNVDPLLSRFKATQLKGKKFILDTDVVLHAITSNASCSKQYRMMIKQLESCGCSLYIPQEIIQEVYNHAEASLKRYHFVSQKIGLKDEDAPKLLKNVFLEDFHYTMLLNNGKSIEWKKYIGNFFDDQYGIPMTAEVIEDILGNKIVYGVLPKVVNIDDSERNCLYETVLEETQKTDKAIHRDFEKNEDIAKVDTLIYLTVKKINEDARNRDDGKKPLLMNDCYFLSSSNRVHYCAKSLGMDADVFCNPKALLAYLAETGYVGRENVQFTKLFDNPFLIYTAKLVEEDINALIDSHVDLKGSKIVRMKYDLQDEIQKSLTITDADEYEEFYKSVRKKGYSFESEVSAIMESNIENKKKIDELLSQLAEAQRMIDIKDEQLALKEKKIGTLEYKSRIEHKYGKR